MNLWQQLQGEAHIRPLSADPWRVVEAQHLSTTRFLVDSMEEHDLLEAMIESSKPAIEPSSDYLIYTPFRYPPLDYGSRFGSAFEPSLWYGSLALKTAFAEVSWYRRLFLAQTSAELGYVETLLTAFQTRLETESGIHLSEPPFHEHREVISAPHTYATSQTLGSAMREAGVEVFSYYSARSEEPAINIAAFTSQVFRRKNGQFIRNQQTWQCIASKDTAEITRISLDGKQRYRFEGAVSFELGC
ncbi:RES domain protein [Legionella geestiana]|uniref:RES domain protein n=1 Tax=Legionella geestiana TaxID=45065 RepID=A0A0W0U467_9GAMM|nr:RES family NAD+ phosphorylase [Legionella geestiana]KTD02720.1 RES domain protein [Legionella geestiana]QBS11282.1 RES domain-containing protein [Legionella geestiana]QDQ40977.1 RES domain-containing protein [Legionella geestiana]STX54086.1 RES domain [Legionella geestiana]